VGAMATPFAPALVHLNLAFVRNDQITGIATLGVIDVNHQVCHLSSKVEILGKSNLHIGHFGAE